MNQRRPVDPVSRVRPRRRRMMTASLASALTCDRQQDDVSVIAAISQRVPTRSGGPQKPVPSLT